MISGLPLSRPAFPRFRPVADQAVLVEFGESISGEIHDRVRQLDAALSAAPFTGFIEAVPAYASILVTFDPLITDHLLVEAAARRLIAGPHACLNAGTIREVLVCYEDEFGPDIAQVMTITGLTREAVIAAHLSGDYKVFMYGFAPGFAYLGGVPETIHLPRKSGATRDIPAGSVLIAGPQCIVTTLVMPTGWWIIGRSPTRILRQEDDRPFLFDVGDTVRFRRIDRATLEAQQGAV